MSDAEPLPIYALAGRLAELYRPDGLEPWRARIVHLTRNWLARDDARLHWDERAEKADGHAVKLPLPGRARPPRWLGLDHPLDGAARLTGQALLNALSQAVGQMEARFEELDRTVPLRWQRSLTPRQTQVAMLVSSGQTNDQIAEQLGIAPRTVVRLIQQIFKRLGYGNRGELAAERALGRPPTPVHQRVPDDLFDALEGLDGLQALDGLDGTGDDEPDTDPDGPFVEPDAETWATAEPDPDTDDDLDDDRDTET